MQEKIFDLTLLNGANGFTIPGVATMGYLGDAVSTAGDINSDGLSDIVLGAPQANSEGACYVIFGNRNGFFSSFNLNNLNGSNGFFVSGLARGDFLGNSVSTAGDVNGDGISDLILGDPYANSGLGASYVLFGSRNDFPGIFNLTNLDGSMGFTIPGIMIGGLLGASVNTAGDVNGDGISDLLLGAPYANAHAGVSYAIFGSRNGFPGIFNLTSLNGTNGFAAPGLVSGGWLGWSGSTAGDVNADGIADLLLQAWGANSNTGADTGAGYVIFGSRSGFPAIFNLTNLNGTNGFIIQGPVSGDAFGYSVSTTGDINADGIADLVLGSDSGTGVSYVIFGSRNGFPAFFNVTNLNGTNGFTVPGIIPNDRLGWSVGTAGDINADGIADLALGSVGDAGAVYVIFGSRNGFLATFDLTNLNGSSGFSVLGIGVSDALGAVSTAGDINGDGVSDLLLGAQGVNSSTGACYVIFGGLASVTWIKNELLITEGQTVVLSDRNINATILVPCFFVARNIMGGRFERVGQAGEAIFNFTQQDVNTGVIQFVSDRTAPVSYDLGVSNGTDTSPNTPANVTFIHHPPEVLSIPLTQIVTLNQAFNFSFEANQIFNDPDGDPLTYSAQLVGDSVLPSWIQFNTHQPNQLTFTGMALSEGSTGIQLSAEDPIHANVSTTFEILAVPGEGGTVISPSTDSNQLIGAVVGGLVGLTALIGAGLGFWRYVTNTTSRSSEQFADYLRSALNLKNVDNFDSALGQQYVAVIHKLEENLQTAGIDTSADKLQQLADDVADAARNKISSATDCLGHSVITITDLNNHLRNLVTEVQILRSNSRELNPSTS